MKEQIGEQTKLASLGLLSDTAFKGAENRYDRGKIRHRQMFCFIM